MKSNKNEICILFYKPFGVLSQFTSSDRKPCLKDFGPFPPDIYPAGRLDFDSEGLLILTSDTRLNHLLTHPRFGHTKTYLVQVEGLPVDSQLRTLRQGVTIQQRKTLPADVLLLENSPFLPERTPPIRMRKNIPTAWLQVTLREGRNRQIRRMTAAIGFPTLRLVRIEIAGLQIENLRPGEKRTLAPIEVTELRRRIDPTLK